MHWNPEFIKTPQGKRLRQEMRKAADWDDELLAMAFDRLSGRGFSLDDIKAAVFEIKVERDTKARRIKLLKKIFTLGLWR